MYTTLHDLRTIRFRSLLAAQVLGVLAATLLSPPASAQDKVSTANFDLANRFTAGKLMRLAAQSSVEPRWVGGRNVFWYSTRGTDGSEYVLVDATTASKTAIADDATLLDLAAGLGIEGAVTVSAVGVSEDLREFRVRIGGRLLRYQIATRELLPLTGDSASALPGWAAPSPDGLWTAYARDYNLYLADADGDNERELTEDGEPFFGYQRSSTFNLVHEERQGGSEPRAASVLWSPNSRRFLTWRVDARAEPNLWVVNSVAGRRPGLVKYKSAFPGDSVRRWHLALYDVERRAMLPITAARWPEQTFEGFEWSPDGSAVYVVRQSPDRLMADLLSVDAETGAASIVIEERPGAHTLTKPLVFLESGQSILWWSRRSGFGHLYLYDRSGQLLRQVTEGRFNVSRVVRVSEEPCVVHFLANGREEERNPYFEHLYRIGCDGNGLRLLTPENAQHSVRLSPDGQFFVDNYSRPE
jgi:dipeptidyl aminopeptidase/acylaminoacyl peptidase